MLDYSEEKSARDLLHKLYAPVLLRSSEHVIVNGKETSVPEYYVFRIQRTRRHRDAVYKYRKAPIMDAVLEIIHQGVKFSSPTCILDFELKLAYAEIYEESIKKYEKRHTLIAVICAGLGKLQKSKLLFLDTKKCYRVNLQRFINNHVD